MSVKELVERVWKGVAQDAYVHADITELINTTLQMEQDLAIANAKIADLEAERERFIKALEIAGREYERVRPIVERFENMAQFAEETYPPEKASV